jgi:hypothetical protein
MGVETISWVGCLSSPCSSTARADSAFKISLRCPSTGQAVRRDLPGPSVGTGKRRKNHSEPDRNKATVTKRSLLKCPNYSTVTLFARFRGLSTSSPRSTATW